jgi:hypothetical protein
LAELEQAIAGYRAEWADVCHQSLRIERFTAVREIAAEMLAQGSGMETDFD